MKYTNEGIAWLLYDALDRFFNISPSVMTGSTKYLFGNTEEEKSDYAKRVLETRNRIYIMKSEDVKYFKEYMTENSVMLEDELGFKILIVDRKDKRTSWILFMEETLNTEKHLSIQGMRKLLGEMRIALDNEEFTNLVEKAIKNEQKGEVADIERKLEEAKEEVDYHKTKVKAYEEEVKKLEEQKTKIEESFDKNELENKMKQLKLIEENEKTEKVEYDDFSDEVVITTKKLYMKNEEIKDDIRELGRMEIKISIDSAYPNFFNLDNPRKGYWGDNCNHPHTSPYGEPCLGNTADMLYYAKEQKDLYATFLLCISFLETYDYMDCAGAYYTSWDKVDENGNIIEEGKCKDYYYTCDICGCEIDEDDYYTCEDCESTICEDHAIWLEAYEKYVCQNCLDEDYIRCKGCGEYVKISDATEDEDGNLYCENCADNLLETCEDCGALYKYDRLTQITISETETKRLCEYCLEEYKEKNEL